MVVRGLSFVNFALGIRTLGELYACSHLPIDALFQDTWRGPRYIHVVRQL
jgi:hypothetical protein